MRTILFLASMGTIFGQDFTAERLIEAGHWKQARAVVQTGSQDSPNTWFLSSQICHAFGDHCSAEALAQKAVALAPQVARYHRQLAEVQGVMAQRAGIFQQLGLARTFRREIDIAIRLDPKDVQARHDLLEFFLLAPGILGGDVKKAEDAAREICQFDAAEGYRAKARIAEFRKDWAQVEEMLRHASEVRPPSYRARVELAKFYLRPEHGNESAAVAMAESAVELDPTRIDGYSILASILTARGEWVPLDSLLSRAANQVPDDPTPYFRAADVLLGGRRELEKAERYFRQYVSQEPEGNQPVAAEAHWKLGMVLRLLGEETKAIGEWRTAVQLDPASPAQRELRKARNAGSLNTSNPVSSGGQN